MSVQDDERERELVRMFNLSWDPAHQRGGVDAVLNLSVDGRACRLEVEVKSTTGSTVATARDVGMNHIRKWRQKFFVIGFYSKEARRPELQHSMCLMPTDMEPWIASIEEKILIDFKLALLTSRSLKVSDLFEICGEQETYGLDDAKRLHKQQWAKEQYLAAQDVLVHGQRRISQTRMLEILQLRARYIAERGATLNNPHISRVHLARFANTTRAISGPNWADGVRQVATDFVRLYPTHPAIQAQTSAR